MGHTDSSQQIQKLFPSDDTSIEADEFFHDNIPAEIRSGKVKILFAHPEAILSEHGRSLMSSKVYQKKVVAVVVDEAHCICLW